MKGVWIRSLVSYVVSLIIKIQFGGAADAFANADLSVDSDRAMADRNAAAYLRGILQPATFSQTSPTLRDGAPDLLGGTPTADARPAQSASARGDSSSYRDRHTAGEDRTGPTASHGLSPTPFSGRNRAAFSPSQQRWVKGLVFTDLAVNVTVYLIFLILCSHKVYASYKQPWFYLNLLASARAILALAALLTARLTLPFDLMTLFLV